MSQNGDMISVLHIFILAETYLIMYFQKKLKEKVTIYHCLVLQQRHHSMSLLMFNANYLALMLIL